jgi:hypothetical protein
MKLNDAKAGFNGGLPLSTLNQLSLFLSTINAPAVAYTSLQYLATVSILSPIQYIISDLIISQFILWTTTLRK